MARRTYVEMVCDALKEGFDNQQASEAKLADYLGWDRDKVRTVVDRGCADDSKPLYRGPGGVVKFRGSESRGTVGIYADVERVIKKYWGGRDRGWRNIEVLVTARGGRRGSGSWVHPDLTVRCDPRRKRHRDDPAMLVSIEVESDGGFDIRSVYQAHSQGRGADYTWVLYQSQPYMSDAESDRILWAAQELGVGLVEFERAGAYGTWHVRHEAEHRDPDEQDRAMFCEYVLGEVPDAAW